MSIEYPHFNIGPLFWKRIIRLKIGFDIEESRILNTMLNVDNDTNIFLAIIS